MFSILTGTGFKFVPDWVAPNLLTFLGFLCVLCYYCVIAFYDPYYDSHDGMIAPCWVWFVAGLLNFAAHTLDGIDGKQARKTGTGSPLGELFDHGLDSWTTGMFTTSIYSLFGATGEFGVPRKSFFYVSLFVMFNFISAHWEKYNTGLFCLPWTYDLSLTIITFTYLMASYVGCSFFFVFFPVPEFLQQLTQNVQWPHWLLVNVLGRPEGATSFFYKAGFVSFPEFLACFTAASSFIGGFCISAVHVARNGKRNSFWEAARPLVPCFTLFVLLAVWQTISPSNIMDNHPRILFWALGTTFAQTTSRLIVAQMSSTRCPATQSCLIILALCVAFACFLLPNLDAVQQLVVSTGLFPNAVASLFAFLRSYTVAELELYTAIAYAVYITLAHSIYWTFVVYELRCHLKIRTFHIPHGAASSNAKKNK